MAQSKPRTRTSALENLFGKRVQIGFKLAKIVHVTLAGISQRAIRPALAAPIHARDGKAAGQQFACHLEIFLNELAAPAENDDRSDR